MSSFFSKYVRSLGSSVEPLAPEDLEALLDKLRGALVHEMKRRSLWSVPPSYLGIYGGSHWTDGDLLEELLFDCYLFIFIRRLPGLKKQATVRANIDGLIFRNIRNFLYEAQRRHDPLGFRIFEVAQAAALNLLEASVLHVLAGDARIRNDTVLGFTTWSDPQDASGVDLRSLIVAWNDQLLPDLITAWSKEDVRNQLQDLIAKLPEEAVEVFQFRDLIEPLKDDARARWKAIQLRSEGDGLLLESGDDLTSVVHWVLPDRGFEDREDFQKLLDCMDESLEQLEASQKAKEYLGRLWLFLRQLAADSETGASSELESPVNRRLEKGIPSAVRLSQGLRIPRGRIPALKTTLGDLVEACREIISGRPEVTGSEGEVAISGPLGQSTSASLKKGVVMDIKSRQEQLRRLTEAAAVRVVEERERLANREDQAPCPGETFLFVETRALPVEWILIEADPADPQRVLVMPMDDQPFVGDHDVTAGVTHIRCRLATWLDAAALKQERRVGALDETSLEAARQKWSDLAHGAHRTPDLHRGADTSPRYLSWIAKLDQARMELGGDPQPAIPEALGKEKPGVGNRQSTPLPFEPAERRIVRSVRRSQWLGYGIAAVLAGAVGGLFLWLGQLRSELSQPLILQTRSAPEIVFLDPERKIETLNLTATETHIGLYLIFSQIRGLSRYRLELLKADDPSTLVWESGEISGKSELLLVLPRRLVTDGVYLLRLYGLDEGGLERRLDDREILIEFSENAPSGVERSH